MTRVSVLAALATLFTIGCGEQPTSAPPRAPTPVVEGHSHGSGPHGGAITDWGGGEYHVEFTVDHDKKEATVYILGGDAKTAAPIKAQSIQLTIDDPMTELELAAQPQEGEAEGTSSRFIGTHDTIGIVQEFAGTIRGEIEGTPYTGDFKEMPAK